jgi:hypothetical protein
MKDEKNFFEDVELAENEKITAETIVELSNGKGDDE